MVLVGLFFRSILYELFFRILFGSGFRALVLMIDTSRISTAAEGKRTHGLAGRHNEERNIEPHRNTVSHGNSTL